MAYYVEPDYWLEGYAEGDAKLTGAQVVAQSVLLAASSRSEVEIGIKADAQSAMLLGANRVVLSLTLPHLLEVYDRDWETGST